MTNFTANQLTKAGFAHDSLKDFTDDGTRFKSYTKDGIYITFAKDEYYVYIRINEPNRTIPFETYKMFPSYAGMTEFNGVEEDKVDVEKLVENVKAVKKDWEAFAAGEKVFEDDVNKMSHDEFKSYLAKKHYTGRGKEDKVFNLAWDYGHSSGHSEVESYYIDLAELAR